MAQHNAREVICVFGQSGSGKTRWLQRFVKSQTRAIIIEGDFPDETDQFAGIRFDDYWEFHDYMKANYAGLFRARYSPRPEEFELMCTWAKEAGACALIIDEADRFIRQGDIDPVFSELVFRGRHFGDGAGVSLVLAVSDPMKLPIDVRRLATRMIIFNNTEPVDVKWLAEMFARDREWSERVPLLQPGTFIEWRKAEGCAEKTLAQVSA